jgi:hypothetical protein
VCVVNQQSPAGIEFRLLTTMEQNNLQLADLPGSATGNETNNGAAASSQGGGDDDDSDKGGDEDVPMTFPQRVSALCE